MRDKYKGLVLATIVPLSILLVFTAATFNMKTGLEGINTYAPWSVSKGHHDAGLFWMTIWNCMEEANVQDDDANYHGEWPGGSGNDYHFHSTIWVGWQDEGGNVYVISSYTWDANVEWIPIEDAASHMWMSDQEGWPDYIEVVSDLDGWTYCDDSGAEEAGPIGLECERHSYQWGVPDHDDWIIYHYTLKNVSGKTLDKLYIGWPYDCDVGGSLDYIDDLVGYEGNDNTDEWTNPTNPGEVWSVHSPDGIPDEYDAVNYDTPQPRSTSYMFDSDGNFPGYTGIRPFGYLGTYPDGEFVFASSQHSWDIMNDPQNDVYKYGYLIDTGVYEEIDTPYDWRMCPAFGPLDALHDGESIDFYLGHCMGADFSDPSRSILELRRNLDQMLADWLGGDGIPGTDDDWVVAGAPPSPKLILVPGDSKVDIHWSREYEPGKNLEQEPDSSTGVVDFDGYILWRSAIGFDTGWVAVAWWDKYTSDQTNCWRPWGWRNKSGPEDRQERVPDGIVDGSDPPRESTTEPDLRMAKQYTYENDLLPQLDEGPYYYFIDDGTYPENDPEWTDNRLKNGFRYFYSVVPYDFGSYRDELVIEPVMGGKVANQASAVPAPEVASDLSNVKVVPNPYIGSCDWEGWAPSLVREQKIAFINLPAKCTIDIYTLSGEWVDRIDYADKVYGVAYWGLSNFSKTGRPGLAIASGVYIYRVSTPDGEEKIGKFAIIVGSDEEAE